MKSVAVLKKIYTNIFSNKTLWFLFSGVLFSVLAAYAATQPAILIGSAIDQLRGVNGTPKHILIIIETFVLYLLLREVFMSFQRYSVEKASSVLQVEAFSKYVFHILKLPISTLRSERSASLNRRLNEFIDGLTKVIKLIVMEALPKLFLSIFAIGYCVLSSPSSGVIVALVLFFGVLVTIHQVKTQNGIRITLNERKIELSGCVVEIISHIPFIRASGVTERMQKKLQSASEEIASSELKHHFYMISYDAVKATLQGAGLASLLYIGCTSVINQEITPGELASMILLFNNAMTPLEALHRVVDEVHESIIRILSMKKILNSEVDKSSSIQEKTSVFTLDKNISAISVKKLQYKYAEGKRVLNNLSFEVKPGEVVGITGPSGCGKSTLLNLISAIEADYEGSLSLFGKEVRKLDRHSLASVLCYQAQDICLLSGTIRQNIEEYLQGSYSDNEMFDALVKARFTSRDSTVSILDDIVSESGKSLSVGQRQRLALARVFLHPAPIIIMDEATSALDKRTEASVLRTIFDTMGHKTFLLVSHDNSVLKFSHRIISLESKLKVDMSILDQELSLV